ncbi:type VI secretion system tube protein TssD [Pseudocitrobacter cyperus]|uniref:Type VI secretion system tube protein TssD n=1 Tax=Pseudocitrobacter cyperus TaxID=3112843 RepID=A0ABV0HIK0_9ENTR
MSNIIYLRITGERQGNISANCGSEASIGNRWQQNHTDEIFAFLLRHDVTNSGRECHFQALKFTKTIDKSSPLLSNAINNNERLFIEIDFYRINRTGLWERYYYIQLRNVFVAKIDIDINIKHLPYEHISVIYDYILCKHLITNTEYSYLNIPAEYNNLFFPQPKTSVPKVPLKNNEVKTPPPAPEKVTPVYAKSCLKEPGCTDAGDTEEPAEHFGEMAIFARTDLDDCCGYDHKPAGKNSAVPAEASSVVLALPVAMNWVWGSKSLGGLLGAAESVPWIGALASALYIPAAGEGSARIPGRDEYWYDDILRQKAAVGGTATTRVRFFWRNDIHGNPQVYGVHTGEGTPYENVRVANMVWNATSGRYEFTPANGVDGPLITWTPEHPENGNAPAHTGNNVPTLDQPTILVTPIPDGKDDYTTPPYPVPDVTDFNDYILVFPIGSGIKPIYVYLKTARDEPGVATGNGQVIPDNIRWLEAASSGIGAPIPAQVADKLRGREFRDFDHFRGDLWKAVSECPELLGQFNKSNQRVLKKDGSPFVVEEQAVGGRKVFEIHHIVQIRQDGPVYNMDNLRINTPRNHIRIHKENE